MSDILCAVCGEPWDAYGIHHGDMRAWEARLFRAGAGCPSCAGKPARGLSLEERDALELDSARSMAEGWDDPHSFPHLNAVLDSAVTGTMPKRPAWLEPPPSSVWECAGCGVRAVVDPELSLVAAAQPTAPLAWHGGRKVHYLEGFAFARTYYPLRHHLLETPDREPCHVIAGKPYCDLCATTCDGPGCSKSIRTDSDELDTYDEGKSFPSEQHWGASLCIDCLEAESAESAENDDEQA